MVADHHRHHSLELEQVEARVVKVAEGTAHVMCFRFSLFLFHQQVMELEAILAVVQADLALQEVQEVPEVHKVEKEHQDHQKKVNFGGDGELVSYPSSFSGVISWGSRLESSFQNTTIVQRATGQTLTSIGQERVFQRSTQAVDSPLAAEMSEFPSRVPWGKIQHWKYMFGKK